MTSLLLASKKWRFYETKASLASASAALLSQPDIIAGNLDLTNDHARGPVEAVRLMKEPNFAELTKRALLQFYAPASVVTDEKGNILYVHGDTGKYLRPAPGQASLNVIEMAREGLPLKLRAAIHSAATQKKEVVEKDLQVKTNGGFSGVNLSIRPFTEPEAAQALLIISFQETEVKAKGKTTRAKQAAKPGRSQRP